MNGQKSLIRLLIVTQTFLLFGMILLPALVRYLHQPLGKLVYGLMTAACLVLALRLRRGLSELE